MKRPYSPPGYMGSQEAVARSVLQWFPEEAAAVKTAMARELATNANDDRQIQELTPTQAQARALALAPTPSISGASQQQIEDALIQTEHRLRGLLHQGVLAAYHFGGLFDQGRHTVAREFWATMEADGLLWSGTIWPFGEPRSSYEPRPNYPLFLLESDLNALWSADPESLSPNAGLTQETSRRELEQPDPAMTKPIQTPEIEDAAVNKDHHKAISKKSQHARERARRAIAALYPNGVPDAASMSNKKLCKLVSEKLSDVVSNDTILRAAGRRK